jgi:hypothetical protein
MSQPTIKTVWNQIVEDVKALDLFADVRPVPLNLVSNVQFLDKFPDIKMPACLIVYLGRAKTIKGSADERENRFNAILVDSDPKGEAWQVNIDRAEEFDSKICDRQILNDEVIIMGSTDMAGAVSNPRFSVYQIAFNTRQAAQREMPSETIA